MATAADLRQRTRTRLEEATAAIWTDAEIDACVTDALESYGRLFPVESTATASIAEGDTTTPVPSGALTVQRVTLGGDTVVPRRSAPVRATRDEELAWEVFGRELHFSRPLGTQTIAIVYTAAPSLEEVPPSDEGLVVLGAVYGALVARQIQDYKRGGQLPLSSPAVIQIARENYERAIAQRSRRVRGGMVATV